MSTETSTPPQPAVRRHLHIGVGLVALGVIVVGAGVLLPRLLSTTDTTTRQFTGSVNHLVVSTSAGPVSIATGDGQPSVTTTTTDAPWTTATSTERLLDGVLELSGTCEGGWGCSVGYRIVVPTRTRIEVRGTAGDVVVTGAEASVDVRLTAGDITITDGGGGAVSTMTTAGDTTISLQRAPDRLDARATAGDITIATPFDRYRVAATSIAGDISVDVPHDLDSPRPLEARTTAGDITIRPTADAHR